MDNYTNRSYLTAKTNKDNGKQSNIKRTIKKYLHSYQCTIVRNLDESQSNQQSQRCETIHKALCDSSHVADD